MVPVLFCYEPFLQTFLNADCAFYRLVRGIFGNMALFSIVQLKYLHLCFNKSCNYLAGIYLHLFVLIQCLH